MHQAWIIGYAERLVSPRSWWVGNLGLVTAIGVAVINRTCRLVRSSGVPGGVLYVCLDRIGGPRRKWEATRASSVGINMVETLNGAGVGQEEIDAVVALVSPLKDEIVTA